MNRTATSLTVLQEIKDVDPDTAKAIRAVWRSDTPASEARAAVDHLIDTCGVEYLGRHKRTGRDVYYCNGGDAYATTIIFQGDRLSVGCWGDLVESNLIIEPNHF